MSRRKLLWISAGCIALVTALTAGGIAIYKHYRWKRFAVVEPGRFYRSGQLETWQLADAIDTLGLRTVVCLNDEQADQERTLCARMGVAFYHLPMPASGVGDPRQFIHFLEIATIADRLPLLVHCHAGVARTGAAVALYRMSQEGWSLDRAIDELRSFERHGYCDPGLRRHIRDTWRTHVQPAQLAHQPAIGR